jgi:hypothetical protein
MTQVVWDAPGTRVFQSGVDHGVLYYYDDAKALATGVAWNGLISVTDSTTATIETPVYIDGIKVLERRSAGTFEGKITAFTYPPEFEKFNGLVTSESGIGFFDQEVSKRFGLSYRTMIGNDTGGAGVGYKIHLLYGLMVKEDSVDSTTNSNTSNATTFSWSLTAMPIPLNGYRPTAHVVIDSTKISSDLLAQIQAVIYGTATDQPRLPRISELNGWG